MKFDIRIFSLIPAIVMMCVIFRFSAQEAELSTKTSTAVGRMVVNAVSHLTNQEYTEEEIEQRASAIDGIVRKSAHMTEYAVLALLVSIPLVVYGVKGRTLFWLTFLITAFYASSDEFHQTFVRGRSGSFKDVLIDCVGIAAYVAILKIFQRKRDFTQI